MKVEHPGRMGPFFVSALAAWLALSLSSLAISPPRCFAGSEDLVIASVNNVSILRSQLERLILEYKKKAPSKGLGYDEKKQLLKNLIRRQLILEQESVQAMKRDKDVVERVRTYEESLIIARFLHEHVGSRLKVNEAELKTYYQDNRHRFSSPPKVEASHILLRTQEEAEEVLQKLREKEDFSQLAKEYSIDLPMALEGGSMGTIEKGKTLPVLEKALFSLSVGETSDIVKTRYGYHILRVDKIIPAGFKSFEEVRNEIKKIVMREKEAKAYDDMTAKLEEEANIKIFEDRLK